MPELLTDCTLVDAEMDRQFETSAPGLSEAASRHLDQCPRCRSLHNWIAEQPLPAEVSTETTAHIRSALVASLGPVKPLPSTRVTVMWLLGIFIVFALGVIAMMGAAAVELMSATQILGIAAILAAGAALLSVSLAWQMVPGSRQRIPLKLVSAVFGLGFLAAVTLLFPWSGSEPFLASGWACSLRGVGVASAGAALFWFLVRRGAPVSPAAMGGMLGAVAGCLGVTVLQFQCIHQYALHLLVWHGGVVVISAGVGALLGAAVTRGFARAK